MSQRVMVTIEVYVCDVDTMSGVVAREISHSRVRRPWRDVVQLCADEALYHALRHLENKLAEIDATGESNGNQPR